MWAMRNPKRFLRAGTWLFAAATVVAAPFADAQSARPTPQRPDWLVQYHRDEEFRSEVLERAHVVRPARRDGPARELNISDDEVREIQVVVDKLLPEAIVNISTVVSDCPCEEGPTCADQVFILASQSQSTLGLQLSRIQNAWAVGAVQRWWLEYENLLAREKKLTRSEFRSEELALARKFPRCLNVSAATSEAKK
jgi:hypothetical protein